MRFGSVLRTRAPAKINLSLHIVGRRADGYHDLDSLVAFAGGAASDHLSLTPDVMPSLTVAGPTAPVAGDVADNLVLKATQALQVQVPNLRVGAFHLDKRLPVAAGIGGGSSDAAAALRLLAQLNDLALDDPRVVAAAQATGADVPVCLAARARTMQGMGEVLGPKLTLPRLFAVLVNAGVGLETRAVFARMGLKLGDTLPYGKPPALTEVLDLPALLAHLARARNDMEDAAMVLQPSIRTVLAVLGAAPGARLARMSGSGATCFALFAEGRAACRAARAIQRQHPTWWVRATLLR